MKRLLAPLLACILLPAAATADVSGTATVIDGDTLEIGGQVVRLYGIDAPEPDQTCRIGGQTWHCGRDAALVLKKFLGRKEVACEQQGIDDRGAVVAVCVAGGEDVAAHMIGEGLALTHPRHASPYATAESAARAAGLGIWRGEFVPPWLWRAGEETPGG